MQLPFALHLLRFTPAPVGRGRPLRPRKPRTLCSGPSEGGGPSTPHKKNGPIRPSRLTLSLTLSLLLRRLHQVGTILRWVLVGRTQGEV